MLYYDNVIANYVLLIFSSILIKIDATVFGLYCTIDGLSN